MKAYYKRNTETALIEYNPNNHCVQYLHADQMCFKIDMSTTFSDTVSAVCCP